jgi:hypothetical protein
MEYKIIDLDADGNGYAVITTDAGESFGQQMTGCLEQTREGVDDYIRGCVARFKATNPPVKPQVPGAVIAQLVGRVQNIPEVRARETPVPGGLPN